MKKKIFLILIMALFVMSAFIEPVSADASTFSEGLTLQHSFENGTILVETFYQTDYTDGKWRITDNKNVDIQLSVIEQPENTTIFVEHMHADCGIYSNKTGAESINGLIQDSMDDKLHVGLQVGFYVSPQYDYNCVFAIEGYSEHFTQIWGFVVSSFGYITSNRRRLTEENLVYYGATGSKFMIVFDLLIKNEGEDYYHTESFMDAFVVNFDGMFGDNTGGILEPDPPEPVEFSLEAMLIVGIVVGGIIVFVAYLCFRD